jgi:hypothetical protein
MVVMVVMVATVGDRVSVRGRDRRDGRDGRGRG